MWRIEQTIGRRFHPRAGNQKRQRSHQNSGLLERLNINGNSQKG